MRFNLRVYARAFQSTPPVKAATVGAIVIVHARRFQSTPPVKAATVCLIGFFLLRIISIHAAREGGDAAGYAVTGFNRISIHAAREGGDRKVS